RVRQQRGAEVVAIRNVEAGARREQDVLLLEQIEREGLVVEVWQLLSLDAHERVHRALGGREVQEAAGTRGFENRATRLVQSPARREQFLDALVTAERG